MPEQIITKTCCTCKGIKPISEFYKDCSTKDGLQSRCKSCKRTYNQGEKNKVYQKTFRQSQEGKAAIDRHRQTEKCKATIKKYRQSEKGRYIIKEAIIKYGKTDKGKAKHRRETSKYRKRHPERIIAGRIIHEAIRVKQMPQAASLKCPCGKQARYYHHPDYSKPLDVVPVCIPCHITIHQVTPASLCSLA